MSKVGDITTITTGYYSTTAISQNFETLVEALNNTLSLDGSVLSSEKPLRKHSSAQA